MVEPHHRELTVADSAPRVKTDRIVASAFRPRELDEAGLQSSAGDNPVIKDRHPQLFGRVTARICEEGEAAGIERREGIAHDKRAKGDWEALRQFRLKSLNPRRTFNRPKDMAGRVRADYKLVNDFV